MVAGCSSDRFWWRQSESGGRPAEAVAAATGTTITISNTGQPEGPGGASGTQVTFTNTSSIPHEMASNPHPTHGSCPEIESGVGFINPGQSKQTGNLNTARTCGYHDHNRDFDTTLQGTITIQ